MSTTTSLTWPCIAKQQSRTCDRGCSSPSIERELANAVVNPEVVMDGSEAVNPGAVEGNVGEVVVGDDEDEDDLERGEVFGGLLVTMLLDTSVDGSPTLAGRDMLVWLLVALLWLGVS
jgi:hypothetical protein